MKTKNKIARLDKKYHKIIRENVTNFVKKSAPKYDTPFGYVLDIAPDEWEDVEYYFSKSIVATLNIDAARCPTLIADITKNNSDKIKDNFFDVVVCTEVLEHVLNPFDAIKEITRILKPNGILLLSSPFNFRIHGPLPDCWRFTRYGLIALLNDYDIEELNEVFSNRFLMPIHYTVVARKAIK